MVSSQLPMYCLKVVGTDTHFSLPWPSTGPTEAVETYMNHRKESGTIRPMASYNIEVKIDEKVMYYTCSFKEVVVAVAQFQKENPA